VAEDAARRAGGDETSEPFDADFVRRLEYWSLFFKRVYGGDLSAARRSREVGSGIEFADRREYLPGDDPRYLDWKAYARLDRVLLRLFEEEKDLRVHVLLDRSSSMNVGEPSKMLALKRVSAAIAYIVLANLDRVAVSVFDETITDFHPPARGKARFYTVLDRLRRVEADGKTDIVTAVSQLAAREKRRALVFILSDFLVSGGIADAMDRLRYHGHELNLIRMVSEVDREPRVSGEVEIRDAETGRTLRAVITPAVLARYRQRFDELARHIESAALAKGARLVNLRAEDSFDAHITSVLRALGKHR
jgi:uncharacterized protein (DUF58 family)